MTKHGRGDTYPFDINISDDDVYEAMKQVQGFIDITPGDFKELYAIAFRHAVDRITRSVRAKDIMTRDVIAVEKDTTLKKVADQMARSGISGVPVIKKDRKVAGVISEKDFLSRMGAKGSPTFMQVVATCLKGKGCVAVDIRAKKAADIMTSPAITVDEDTTAHDIADIFTQKNINRVPVVNKDGQLTGIVSRGDVVEGAFIKKKTGNQDD